MVRNFSIQVRLRKDEYQRIREKALVKGFESMSSYLRYVALENEFESHQKVHELHAALLGPKADDKRQRRSSWDAPG